MWPRLALVINKATCSPRPLGLHTHKPYLCEHWYLWARPSPEANSHPKTLVQTPPEADPNPKNGVATACPVSPELSLRIGRRLEPQLWFLFEAVMKKGLFRFGAEDEMPFGMAGDSFSAHILGS